MPNDRIRLVRLDRFRGATRATAVAFDVTRPIVLLFGENGAGKSSVVDAIDAVGNGSRGSIADRSSTSARHHLPSAGATAAELAAEVETARGAWRARLTGDTLATVPPYDGAPVYVLRRAGLLALVNAAPAERFEVLERFVDVGGVEKSEAALAAAVRDAAAAAQQIEAGARHARTSLDELWIQEGRPGAPTSDAEAWAETQTALDTGDLESVAARATAGAQAAAQLARDAETASAADARAAEAGRALDAAVAGLTALSRQGAGREIALILAETERLLGASPPPNECPVCERAVDAAALRDRIAERLRAGRALTSAVAAVDAAERAAHAADEAGRDAVVRRTAAARALAALLTPDRLAPELQRAVHVLRDDGDVNAAGAREAAATLAGAAVDLRDRAAARAAKSQQQIGHLRAVRAAYAQVLARRDELHDVRRAHERLADTLALVRRERTAYVQEVLDAVRDECNRLYALVHPGERVALRRLRLDEKRRRSLHQDADFEGHEGVPPQAYFSESHLDTLGFCFWLAVTKHAARAGVAPIVVLDDVFASADAAHTARVLALLVAESSAFTQVIVATHERAWVGLAEDDAVARGAVGVVTFGAWSLAGGIVT